jgi:hypothetical protein
MPKKVALLCRWGDSFGMGHIQRMASLCSFLADKGLEPRIITNQTLPADLRSGNMRTADLDASFDMIVRDMRDSSAEDISLLKKKAPVAVIDDLGEGRGIADSAIDLLPNLVYPVPQAGNEPFIYGYNFSRAIATMKNTGVQKTTDFCIYAGAEKSEQYMSFIRDVLPAESSAVIVGGGEIMRLENGREIPSELSYPLPLLFSENLISHFGISLFEGALCGCSLFSINPTRYHSELCVRAKPLIDIENFGVYPEIDIERVKNRLKEAVSEKKRTIEIGQIRARIDSGLELFYDRIKPLM